MIDPEEKKEFVPCEYYRIGKSYRSPLSNKYYPKVEEAIGFPTETMRKIEVLLNRYLVGYLKHYYGNAIGSAYAIEKETSGQYQIIVLISNGTTISSRSVLS